MPFIHAKKPFQVNDDQEEIVNNGCLLLPAAKIFFKHGMKKPLSEATLNKLEKKARKLFRSANLQPSRVSIVYCDHPIVLAEFSDAVVESESRDKLTNKLAHEAKYKGAALAWMPKRGVQMFEKVAATDLVKMENTDAPSKEDTASEVVPENSETTVLNSKSNTGIRGKATGILLKQLPTVVSFGKFKSSLPFRAKSVSLFKKSGQRNALLSFSTPVECSAAFDSLQNFVYEGQKIIPAFVIPRATVAIENPKSAFLTKNTGAHCLDIKNISFGTTLEQLKDAFPTAENIIMRRRKDGKSKGSCILSFENLSDCQVVLEASRQKDVCGRRIVCQSATSEEFAALAAELTSRPLSTPKHPMEGRELKLFNLPFSTSELELKKIFPECRHIFFPQVKGANCGIALLTFKTPTICQTALKKAQNLKLQERKVRADINVTFKKTDKKTNLKNEMGNKDKLLKQKRHQPDNEKTKMKSVLKLNKGPSPDDDDDIGWAAPAKRSRLSSE